jgi:response regulator RpfG family c-di-GMP phosphodiesterase
LLFGTNNVDLYNTKELSPEGRLGLAEKIMGSGVQLVFMDYRMPFLFGPEYIYNLRGPKVSYSGWIFGFTGEADDQSTVTELIESGADIILRKPTTSTFLRQLFSVDL